MQKTNQPLTADAKARPFDDPGELARNLLELYEEGARAMAGMLERADLGVSPFTAASEWNEAGKALGEIARHWLGDPAKLAEAQGELVRGYADLWNAAVRRTMGEEVAPVAAVEAGDNRFKDPAWSDNPYFDFWKQLYLLTAHWAESVLARTGGERPSEVRVAGENAVERGGDVH